MMKKFLGMMLVAGALLAGCGNDGTQEAETATDETQEVAEAVENEGAEDEVVEVATEDEEVVEEEIITTVALGDTFEIDGFEITLQGVEIVDWVERENSSRTSWGWEPDEGSKFVLVELSATNNNTEATEMFSRFSRRGEMGARIMYRDSFEFLRTDFLGWEYRLEGVNVNPLSTISGKIPFMVPDVALDGDESLVLELFIANEVFTHNLR